MRGLPHLALAFSSRSLHRRKSWRFSFATCSAAISPNSAASGANDHVSTTEQEDVWPRKNSCCEVDETFAACWSATSQSANPHGDAHISQILQGLDSPAPQSLFVIERTLPDATSLQIAVDQCHYLLKAGHHFSIPSSLAMDTTHNATSSCRPGIDWTIVPPDQESPDGWDLQVPQHPHLSCRQIAQEILDFVVEKSEAQEPISDDYVEAMVDRLDARLHQTLGTDIRGRTAADTALALALAGVTRPQTFERLLDVTRLELERTHGRPSRRAQDVAQVVEKLAAAGMTGPAVDALYKDAATWLRSARGASAYQSLQAALASSKTFHLLSPRPLLWLWRFSARQTKAKEKTDSKAVVAAPMASGSSHAANWVDRLQDPSKPLVVDVGCGFGTCLLGLASLDETARSELPPQVASLHECNFVGGDLSQLATRFGSGIATRWNLSNKLQFTHASGNDLLHQVNEWYPGPVHMILIQFPSPYRLHEDGNSQLPQLGKDNENGGFMVTHGMMEQIAKLLSRSNGYLLVQSNCEDVAVLIRDLGLRCSLVCEAATHAVTAQPAWDAKSLPQRTLRWIKQGGERAIGREWSSQRLLPPECMTETEASCLTNGTPIHRCLMRATSAKTDPEPNLKPPR